MTFLIPRVSPLVKEMFEKILINIEKTRHIAILFFCDIIDLSPFYYCC